MARHIVILGASHRSAPVEIREQLIAPLGDSSALLSRLEHPSVQEIALLSTCNRVEIVAAGSDADAMLGALTDIVKELCGVDDAWVRAYMRSHVDREAFSHLFRVASSLESVVVGEPQILGQVKQAYQSFFGQRMTGPLLNRAFHRAFFTAKRVRTETGIAENAVSVSYAAVQLAREELQNLSDVTVMVVGAGKMGVLAAKHLRQAGASRIVVLNRSLHNAQRLADEVGGDAYPLDELERWLPRADVILTSTGASQFLFETRHFAFAEKRESPVLVIDIAVPRDVDPLVGQLPNVRLFGVDDLERVVDESLDYRRAEARRAERIVQHEADTMATWLASQDAIASVVALRSHVNEVFEEEFLRHVEGNAQWSAEQIEEIRRFGQSFLNKLLHPPTAALREADDALPDMLAVLQRIFPLHIDEDEK